MLRVGGSLLRKVPELDRAIGVYFYYTDTPGIGGVLRKKIEDFVVKEILKNGTVIDEETTKHLVKKGEGPFLHCLMVKYDVETFLAIEKIANKFRVKQNHVKVAGLKDRRAVSYQRISIKGVKPEQVRNANINGVKLYPLYQSWEPVNIGDLWGNLFKVVIREVRMKENTLKNVLDRFFSEVYEKGIPNWYGYQRFGVKNPNTHLIGRNIVKGNFGEAVRIFLKNSLEPELAELVDEERYSELLERIPRHLVFEYKVIKYLAGKPKDYVNAFRRLNKDLRRLYIHAYQAFLFNKVLSRRIEEGMPIREPVTGDVVWDEEKCIYVRVKQANLREVKEKCRKGKATVCMRVIGYAIKPEEGEIGEIEKQVLEEEGVRPEDFIIRGMPEISSRGHYREAELIIKNLKLLFVGQDETSKGALKVGLRFAVKKGGYATTLLRELMKTEPEKLV